MPEGGLPDSVSENPVTILQELYNTVHGFWDKNNNERVPGVIDIQEEQGKDIKKLTNGQWIIGSIGVATFISVAMSGHFNGTVLLEIIKLFGKLFGG